MTDYPSLAVITESLIYGPGAWPFMSADISISRYDRAFVVAFKADWPERITDVDVDTLMDLLASRTAGDCYALVASPKTGFLDGTARDLAEVFTAAPRIGAAVGRYLTRRSDEALRADKLASRTRFGAYDDLAPAECAEHVRLFDAQLSVTAMALDSIPEPLSTAVHPVLLGAFLTKLMQLDKAAGMASYFEALHEVCEIAGRPVVYTPAFATLSHQGLFNKHEQTRSNEAAGRLDALRDSLACDELTGVTGEIFDDRWTGKTWCLTFSLPWEFQHLGIRLFLPSHMSERKLSIDMEIEGQGTALTRTVLKAGAYEDVYIRRSALKQQLAMGGGSEPASSISIELKGALSHTSQSHPDKRDLGCFIAAVAWK